MPYMDPLTIAFGILFIALGMIALVLLFLHKRHDVEVDVWLHIAAIFAGVFFLFFLFGLFVASPEGHYDSGRKFTAVDIERAIEEQFVVEVVEIDMSYGEVNYVVADDIPPDQSCSANYLVKQRDNGIDLVTLTRIECESLPPVRD